MASETEFWGRPVDTSTLGPVRVDPDATAARARMVREALMEARKAAVARPGGVRGDIWRAFNDLCDADDETLAHLGRLLK